ncbi:MAG: fumarylacetoacetate hydrolase family protein [Gaiellales bacterium]|jgi:2,4-didehydro-3-deoxy-L-rhamnonate hydrolase
MRLISFEADGLARAGVLDGEVVRDTGLAMSRLLQRGLDRAPAVGELPLSEVRLLPPVPGPGKIACIGRNYHEHAREQDVEAPAEPLVFAKFSSSLIADGEPIRLSPLTERPDYEAELAAVIGRPARRVSERDALGHIAGYTVMNDVTARDLQRADGQWTRAKGLDTFGPMGPALVTPDEVGDPQALRIRCQLNGELVQDASTGQMIHSVARLIAHLSQAFTLHPGDVIATGTPSGVGAFRDPPRFLQPGDIVRCEVERVGALENPVLG